MTQYSIELGTRKYVKGCRFLSFARKYKIHSLKTASKKFSMKQLKQQMNLYGKYC